jgi:hypothetical protein
MSSTPSHGLQQCFTVSTERASGERALVVSLGRNVELWEADTAFSVTRESAEISFFMSDMPCFFRTAGLTAPSLPVHRRRYDFLPKARLETENITATKQKRRWIVGENISTFETSTWTNLFPSGRQ